MQGEWDPNSRALIYKPLYYSSFASQSSTVALPAVGTAAQNERPGASSPQAIAFPIGGRMERQLADRVLGVWAEFPGSRMEIRPRMAGSQITRGESQCPLGLHGTEQMPTSTA